MKTYEEYRAEVELALGPMLESLGAIPDRLLEAMRYSLLAGGKRLRPVMLLAACDMAGGDITAAIQASGDYRANWALNFSILAACSRYLSL